MSRINCISTRIVFLSPPRYSGETLFSYCVVLADAVEDVVAGFLIFASGRAREERVEIVRRWICEALDPRLVAGHDHDVVRARLDIAEDPAASAGRGGREIDFGRVDLGVLIDLLVGVAVGIPAIERAHRLYARGMAEIHGQRGRFRRGLHVANARNANAADRSTTGVTRIIRLLRSMEKPIRQKPTCRGHPAGMAYCRAWRPCLPSP